MDQQISPRAALGRMVIGISRSWRRAIDQALADRGLSEAMALPLLVLLRGNNVRRQCEIAEALHLERPALVRIMDLLVKAGYVQRSEDPGDRRAKILILTRAGRAQALAMEKVVEELRRQILAGIQDDELLATLKTLQTVENNVRGLAAQPGRHA